MLIDIPSRVRWPEVIDALAKSGMSNAALARQCGIDKGTIRNLRSNGGEPLFSNGIKILRLFVERIPPNSA